MLTLRPVASSQVYITPYRAVGVTSTASNQNIALWCLKKSFQNNLKSGGQANAADAVNIRPLSQLPFQGRRKLQVGYLAMIAWVYI